MKTTMTAAFAAALLLIPALTRADTTEGGLVSYTPMKNVVLRVKGKTRAFVVDAKTKFYDTTGQEIPECADPKERLWQLSDTITVLHHREAGKEIADGVKFPYGKVPPELLREGAPAGPDEETPLPSGVGEPITPLAIRVGDPLPEFEIATFAGKTLTNASLSGKVFVLDFWATWCGPCKKISPVMQGLHDRFQAQGVAVIGANCFEQQIAFAKGYVKEHGYTFSFGSADALAKKLNVQGIPLVLVVDRKGIVQHIQEGYEEGCGKTLSAKIQALLGEKR